MYYSPLNRRQLIRPVILSDGFSSGSSELDRLWNGLEENGDYRFISELHACGRDVIILGYHDRTAPIGDNAGTAVDCIRRALAERVGRSKLVVGGFSMGGLVTRYALARMEQDPSLPDHETALHLSYDSPTAADGSPSPSRRSSTSPPTTSATSPSWATSSACSPACSTAPPRSRWRAGTSRRPTTPRRRLPSGWRSSANSTNSAAGPAASAGSVSPTVSAPEPATASRPA
ncbi:esterase/lipase family protein [Streptomyces zhihengii]